MTDSTGTFWPEEEIAKREPPLRVKGLTQRVWTESKAQLIQRYLRLFELVTFNGTYLDAFAGPQNENQDTSWAARLVLEMTPKWFSHFVLFEQSPESVALLEKLKSTEHAAIEAARAKARPGKERSKIKKRKIEVIAGDSNVELPAFLQKTPIKGTKAVFCLLDQRTTECDWATVASVALHKTEGRKIEIFYFLASWWLERTVAALKDPDPVMKRWWGRNDWPHFLALSRKERALAVAERLKHEFGYKHAFHYPIYKSADSSQVMFYMIHATDHDAAPELMNRAYNGVKALGAQVTQQDLDFAKELLCHKSTV